MKKKDEEYRRKVKEILSEIITVLQYIDTSTIQSLTVRGIVNAKINQLNEDILTLEVDDGDHKRAR
jgi:uncharacterized protein YejL (UPF0352 family)